jgi:hypothetical protein
MTVAFGAGYGAMMFGSGISQNISLTQSGRYVTPEQTHASQESSYAAGGGSILGALVGAPFGAAASLALQFAGGAAGQVYGANATASGEVAASTRQTGELLTNEVGGSTQALREFTSALTEAGAPIKELQTAFTTLSQLAPISSSDIGGAVASAGLMSNALGERYNPALSGASSYISSNPILAPGGMDFARSAGRMTPGELGTYAVSAAFQGDYGSALNFETLESGASLTPLQSREAGFVRKEMGESDVEKGYEQIFFPSRLNAAYSAAADVANAQNAAGSAISADVTAAWQVGTAAKSGIVQSQTEMGVASGRLTMAEMMGQSPSVVMGIAATMSPEALAAAGGGSPDQAYSTGITITTAAGGANAPPVFGANGLMSVPQSAPTAEDAARSRLTAANAGIQAYLSSHSDLQKTDPRQYAQLVDLQQQNIGALQQIEVEGVSNFKSAFDYGLNTETTGYSLGITQRELAGGTAASMASDIQKQANFLTQVANDAGNPMTPAERTSLLSTAAQMPHENLMRQYGQTEAGLGVQVAAGASAVGVATAGGTTDQLQSAQQQQMQSLLSVQQQITEELSKQGLTYDEQIAKQRQLVEIGQQIATLNIQNAQVDFERAHGVASANIGYASTVSGIAISGYGNVGGSNFDASIIPGQESVVASDRARLAQLPPGTEPYRAVLNTLGNDQQTLFGQVLTRDTYSPSGATDIAVNTAMTNLAISEQVPYLDYGSNPMIAAMAGIKAIQGEESDTQKSLTKAMADTRSTDPTVSSAGWAAADADTQKLNAERLHVASLQRQQYTSEFNAIPEAVWGGQLGGTGTSIIPFGAASSYFGGGNPFLTGTWGAPPHPSSMSPSNPVAGGSAGGFFDQAMDPNAALVAAMKELTAAIKSRGAGGNSAPPGAPPSPGMPNVRQVQDTQVIPLYTGR